MAVAISPRTIATIVYLALLFVALSSTAAIDRSEENNREANNKELDYRDIVNSMDDVDDANNYRRALVILKRVLAKAASPDSSELMTPFRKRTCYFNAGMSHSCDYKELLKSVDEANYWSSDFTPGRRRKRDSSSIRKVTVDPILPAVPY